MFKLFADYFTYSVLNLPKGAHISESVNFFMYDTPKIFVMIVCVLFFVALLRTYLPPERIKRFVTGKTEFAGNIFASLFGVFMPFCTCSSIPIFMGMLQAGVPLGVTMSFLIASPIVNEIAVVLLWGLFGWRAAITYVISGMLIAIFAGYIIGKLKMEKYLTKIAADSNFFGNELPGKAPFSGRLKYAYKYTIDIIKSVWLYIFIGIGIGAFIHGYVPDNLLAQYAGKDNPFAVIMAVLIGIPVYANCVAAIPVAQALIAKGLPLGTSLAFLMAVAGLSLPEFFILRTVLKPRLLFTLFGVAAFGIILIGYFFNLIF